MNEQPKISNLTPNQKPQYSPLLFDWAPAPLAPKTGESSDFYTGAFTLVPKTNGSINVVEDYNWTLSGPEARKLVPKVLLTEYYQTLSSELVGYLYTARGYVSNLVAGANQGVESARAAAAAVGQAAKSSTQPAQGLATQTTNTFATKQDQAVEVSTAAAQNVSRKDGLTNTSSVLKSATDPYFGLYTVKKSGFSYTLPYYTEKSMIGVGNQWGKPGSEIAKGIGSAGSGLGKIFDALSTGKKIDSEPTGLFGKAKKLFNVAEGLGNIVGGLAGAGLAAGGGATSEELAAEIPKAYKGTDLQDSINLTFYLYNTFDTDVASIKRNWDLCFLLTYQNLPNRLAKNLLHPPCLYEIEVPGYKRIPLAYLTNIDIANVGNVRIIDLATGEAVMSDRENANCKLIPEAYKITLGFQSVLKNTRNTFLYTAIPGDSISITITETPT